MFEFLVISQFVSALFTLAIGVGLIYFIRKKTDQLVKENRPAGFWVRAICLGTDVAIIDILVSILAYRGSLVASGHITILLTLSYFFFFWLFFSGTPAMMFARIRIVSKDEKSLKFWQVSSRLAVFVFLFIGWIAMLFDKKEKKTLHDIVSKTRVVYKEGEKTKDDVSVKRIKFGLLGLAAVLLIGFMVNGLGEKLNDISENDQISFFDLNGDDVPEGLTIDVDKDGTAETYKYDFNNDHVVDFTTFDTDKDGVAESIDVNNDGRVDGFDFDNDNIIDIEVAGGQFFIRLWRVLFGTWVVSFSAILVLATAKEKRIFKKQA